MKYLLHGTPIPLNIIKKEGLIAGDNTHGGNRGVYEENQVCLTEYRRVAEKYAHDKTGVVIVDVEGLELHKDTDADGVYYYSLENISPERIIDYYLEIYDELIEDFY